MVCEEANSGASISNLPPQNVSGLTPAVLSLSWVPPLGLSAFVLVPHPWVKGMREPVGLQLLSGWKLRKIYIPCRREAIQCPHQ